jgi:hypothetical protein
VTTSSGDGERSDDPHAIDAAFDDIVARIGQPDTAASTAPWPEAENRDPGDSEDSTASDAAAVTPPARTPRQDWPEWDDVRVPAPTPDELADAEASDEGHYEPPPPPPVPRGDSIARWAWAGAIGAPALAILLPILGWDLDGLTGIVLVIAFLTGFGTLVSRLRPGPRVDDGPDDGAIV